MKIVNYINDKLVFKMAEKYRRNFEKFYFKCLRKKLTNTDFSLFSPNCYAGIIYHRLGLPFLSPTINMFFPVKKQYLKFVSNLKYYLQLDLEFIDDDSPFPVAMLGDVKIAFNHYKTREEAENSWNKRKARVNYNNIFIIFDDIADIEYDDLVEFCKIDCAGKVIITAKEYKDIPCAVQLSKYKKTGVLQAYLLDTSKWTGINAADKDFDFVSWLNNK